jgi:uncharacterized membrane protein HdeD (DUF308 family)
MLAVRVRANAGVPDPDERATGRGTFILRGVLAIAFGVVALVSPPATIAALVLLFGTWALVDGVFLITGAIQDRTRTGRSGSRWSRES